MARSVRWKSPIIASDTDAISCFASNFSGEVSRFVTRCGSSLSSSGRLPPAPLPPSPAGRIGLEEEEEAEGASFIPGRRMLGVRSSPLRWSASFIEIFILVPVTESTLT